jgi:ceramide glucosyltransferase
VGPVEVLLLIPVLAGSLFYAATLATSFLFLRAGRAPSASATAKPPISILKPIYGLERNLERNLRSALSQDYPDYQVVLSVQRLDDPALPLLRKLEQEYALERATVVAVESKPIANGKVQNLENGLAAARHEILVISDSDVFTPQDYLSRIFAPFADPELGYVCTLYKGVDAESWYEKLELLSYNAEFIPSTVFAYMTGASGFCLGASVAFRRKTLDAVGGMHSLIDYLAEDYELGRRIRASGRRMVLLPYFVDLTVDIASPSAWWRHQLYWDQNTRVANPLGFALSVVTRAVPFALMFATLRLFDPLGLAVLGFALLVRFGTAAGTALIFGDREGLRMLFLLPLRDLAGLMFWAIALGKRRFDWRGEEFELTRSGRIAPRKS